MKPLQLEIEAFGAFAQKQTVQFSVFEQNRLFLIHGPTGSGKTTIFDAMCYALYGETTGNRKGVSMRSDHVSEKEPTRVVFIFQFELRMYRAEREMKMGRTGNLNENQSFCEVIWDETNQHYREISTPLTKKREILEAVEELLGFSAQQFKQIVILPQGKFQELLLSPTDEKQKILTQLFNASIYEKITQELLEKSKSFKKGIEERAKKIQARLESVGYTQMEALKEGIQTFVKEQADKKTALPALEAGLKQSREVFQEARQLNELYISLEKTQESLRLHLQREALIKKKILQKELADKAEVLRGSLEEMDLIKEKVLKKQGAIKTYHSIIIGYENRLNKVREEILQLEDLKEEVEEKKIRINEFQKLKPQFAELDQINKQIAQHQEKYQALVQLIIQDERMMQDKDRKIEAVNLPALEQLEQIYLKKGALEEKVKHRRELKQRKLELSEARQQFKDLENKKKTAFQQLEELGQKRLKAQHDYEHLERLWRNSQAALLAEKLLPQEPCPVCGSLDHPHPAEKTDTYVSNEEIKDAKLLKELQAQHYDEARQAFNEIDKELGIVLETGKQIAEQLGDLKDLSDLEFQSQLESFQKQLQQAQEAEIQSQKIKEENLQLRQEITVLKEKLKGSQGQLQGIKDQLSQQEAGKKSIEQHLPEDLHSESELDQRIFQLQDEILQFQEKLKTAQESQKELEQNISNQRTKATKDEREIKTLESELDDRERKLGRDLKNKGFQSVDEIRGSLLNEEVKVKMLKEIEEWKHRQTELKSYIQQNQEKIGEKPRPDIEPLQLILGEKEKELESHKDLITRLGSQVQALEKQASALDKLKKELAQQEKASDAVIQLADLANGSNELNQKFQTYVLSVFLDDVVDYANKRLRILSQDRYQLQRSEEVLHGNRKAGLDLKVFDSYSGKERLVHNLSGGETFFTSLALALGLADVATANAGGIRLDAMFIDEGFGTLDSETLDLAIKTLMNLDGEYRLVGIISHVAELKERIPSSRLEVLKGRNGSRMRIHAV